MAGRTLLASCYSNHDFLKKASPLARTLFYPLLKLFLKKKDFTFFANFTLEFVRSLPDSNLVYEHISSSNLSSLITKKRKKVQDNEM